MGHSRFAIARKVRLMRPSASAGGWASDYSSKAPPKSWPALLLSSRFGVLVRLQVRCGHVAFGASARHFDLGGPEDRVHDHPAELRNAPVAVVMRAREAEASAAVRAVDCPGDSLLVWRVLRQ